MDIVFLEGQIENGSRKDNNKRQSKVKEIVEKNEGRVGLGKGTSQSLT